MFRVDSTKVGYEYFDTYEDAKKYRMEQIKYYNSIPRGGFILPDDKFNDADIVEVDVTTAIRELIKNSDKTQKEFAEYFGIPKRTIENWATGARKCPEYVVRMMAKILFGEDRIRRSMNKKEVEK